VNLSAADRIPGMMSIPHLKWLARIVAPYKSVLELGSWRGRSTRLFCDNCPGLVTAVDTWCGSPGLEEEMQILQEMSGDADFIFHDFQRNMEGVHNLETIRMSTCDAAAKFKLDGRKFNCVFIDALHDYPSVRADILNFLPLVSIPGVICGHDFQYPDVHRAVTEIFPSLGRSSDPQVGIWGVTLVPPTPEWRGAILSAKAARPVPVEAR
jgi:hypothetical protein